MRAKLTRRIYVGKVPVGGGAPVSVQSMTKTDTRDATATAAQIAALAREGCEIIRVAVPDERAARALQEIVGKSPIPVIADIHFNYRLAIIAADAGVHCIRINPGNIGDEKRVRAVAEHAAEKKIPIRVGVNSGSLPKGLCESVRRGAKSDDDALADALVRSALDECASLEKYGFRDIKVSLKASNVPATVAAYRKFSELSDYPLHVGVTEAGTMGRGMVKSAMGIGALLLDGIGDTIRVSLTADPVEEVRAGIMILECAGLREAAPEVVSCPTCGRAEADVALLAGRLEAEIGRIKAAGKKIRLRKIAIMGCAVNGPGEAKDADIGIAGGKNNVLFFRHGKIEGRYTEEGAFQRLIEELRRNVSN